MLEKGKSMLVHGGTSQSLSKSDGHILQPLLLEPHLFPSEASINMLEISLLAYPKRLKAAFFSLIQEILSKRAHGCSGSILKSTSATYVLYVCITIFTGFYICVQYIKLKKHHRSIIEACESVSNS